MQSNTTSVAIFKHRPSERAVCESAVGSARLERKMTPLPNANKNVIVKPKKSSCLDMLSSCCKMFVVVSILFIRQHFLAANSVLSLHHDDVGPPRCMDSGHQGNNTSVVPMKSVPGHTPRPLYSRRNDGGRCPLLDGGNAGV